MILFWELALIHSFSFIYYLVDCLLYKNTLVMPLQALD
ncbi:hypothetical protein SAMN06269173_102266 [Hymenobacter mucosus]|uniref:Uncharacterized protein n=1 Tax=Hymenobacter mucosus TaxID=1411120 RepID=A0A238W669_9BACT|nr:hypothetical protein SAMN06269173_102266 [Hymenobacter mucosus]